MRVALVVKNSISTQGREGRNMGYWSYPVPEFEWTHFVFGGRQAYADRMNSYDLIFQEDAGPRDFKDCKAPLVYLAIDSTLSDDHLEARLERAQQADLILVDMDDLARFEHLGIPVRRLNYCVNDRLMKDYGEERAIDVSFHCAGNGHPDRKRVRELLSEFCQKSGLTFESGILPLPEYAKAMARSKIVVNWPRTATNRPHRVFDAMACGACLISGPFPQRIPGDEMVVGRDYLEVEQIADLPMVIDHLLKSGEWRDFGRWGKRLIGKYHTWSIRARQLRQILKEELDL